MEGEKSMTKRILIVEDNAMSALEIQDILKKMGNNDIYIASNYARSIELYKSKKPNMLLLDIDLQDEKDGINIAKQIRKTDDIPIIYLTADTDEETIKRASLTKPSNYLNKPFSQESLKTAITLAWSMYHHHTLSACEFSHLSSYHSYDYCTENLYECDTPIHLSPNEKNLIKIFCQSKKQLLDTASLSNLIWMGETPDSDNALRTLIYRLHHKLKYKLLEYVPPIGYRVIQYSMPPSDEEMPS